MLADGRIRDAAEYLGLSQRLCQEAHDLPGALWTDVYMAACLFVEGRFTQAIAAADRGSLLARAVFRREVELFLLFLKSRAMFAVGAYEEASLLLQGCLTVATLYGAAAALPVLRAWLGRTAVHQGDHESGTRMLESLPPTLEVLYFLAEASLFAGNLEAASRCLDQGLALPAGSRFALPEGIPWTDGYAGVEGRCFRLSRADAFVRRSLSGLRAYLLGMRGLRTEGIRELHQLTRGEKLPDGDPSAAWLNFLYARILPEAGVEEVDDRLTVLSKSLKSLQERASRIDAPAQRSSYLWQARWNRMIMEEARERKLL
jgi:tetratricopeptide (TPR) repeat protein